MHKEKVHSIEHRIVSIHQPHVRPMVRGKTNANVEFGAKIQVSLMNGYAFLDDLSWEAFNEGARLMGVVENYIKTGLVVIPKKYWQTKSIATVPTAPNSKNSTYTSGPSPWADHRP